MVGRSLTLRVLAEARRRDEQRHATGWHVLDSFALEKDSSTRGVDVHVVVVERTLPNASLNAADIARRFQLTPREAEVALGLDRRWSASEISRSLGISQHTARRHTESVLRKLGVNSRRDVERVLRSSAERPEVTEAESQQRTRRPTRRRAQ